MLKEWLLLLDQTYGVSFLQNRLYLSAKFDSQVKRRMAITEKNTNITFFSRLY